MQTVFEYFMDNIDITGSGAVVAAPDHNTGPGGDYYFHWMRDGALSMKTLVNVAPRFNASSAPTLAAVEDYCHWVVARQGETDPHNIDVRLEPKFTIPAGEVFAGAWCRPQTDGPGLRSRALISAVPLLEAAGKGDYVDKVLWTKDGSNHGGAIRYDLDWVAANWRQQSCDLWEEIQSDDFFWNRYMFRACLKDGAAFAKSRGDTKAAAKYNGAASDIEATLGAHFAGGFLYEAQQRLKDTAVIEALNHGYLEDGFLSASSNEAAQTVAVLTELFCGEYDINQADADAGVPGVLYGRYEGDNYDGGNPWILLSASVARLLFRASAEVSSGTANLTAPARSAWAELVGVGGVGQGKGQLAVLAQAMIGAGDGILHRVRKHIDDAGTALHMNEQLDRNTGKPTSAKDLTWNYANVLSAMADRTKAAAVLGAGAAAETTRQFA